MHRSLLYGTLLITGSFATSLMYGQANVGTTRVTLSEPARIPGSSLAPGVYTFSLEDNMSDRAIVRIENKSKDQHYLVLAVPSTTIKSQSQGGISWFRGSSDEGRAIRGWKCPRCASTLEFVYPKLEAVAITGQSGQPAMAVDPASDKLPQNLNADDMKVVTLWLLSPKQITADNKGEGVNAQKFSEPRSNSAQVASAEKPQVRSLPATASHTTEIGLLGLAALIIGGLLSAFRRTQAA